MYRADRFTAPLMTSPERRHFAARLAAALALAGDRHDERVAIGQSFAEDHANHDFVRALADVDRRRAAGESVAVAGVCGTGMPPANCGTGPNVEPHCYTDGRRLCDLDRVGARTGSIAGNGTFSISPQPGAGSAWWRPRAVRGYAFRTADPSIPAHEGLFVTSVTVGTAPVEGFNTPAAAGVTDGISFGEYVVPDLIAVPVGWPIFSLTNLAQALVVSGIGLWPAASTYIAGLTVLGNRSGGPSDPNESRVHPGSSALPRYTSRTM